MASQRTGVSGLADRYAAALFDLADEHKALDQVSDDLRRLRAMLNESAELRRRYEDYQHLYGPLNRFTTRRTGHTNPQTGQERLARVTPTAIRGPALG